MTGTVLAARVSEYLGVGDVTTEPPFSTRILSALNRAADVVGAEAALPIGSRTETAGATYSFTVHATIRPDMILSAEAEGPYGSNPLAIIQPSEMYSINLQDTSTSGAPQRPVALVVDLVASTVTLFPKSYSSFQSTIRYTGVLKSVDMGSLSAEPWGGAVPSAHLLVAMRAAIGMMEQDGRAEEARALWQLYERERVMTMQRVHGPRLGNELIKRLLTLRDYAGGEK